MAIPHDFRHKEALRQAAYNRRRMGPTSILMLAGFLVWAIAGTRVVNQLIRDGAKLVETAQEVIDELAPMVREWRDTLLPLTATPGTAGGTPQSGRVESDDVDYTLLRQALGYDPVSIDTLVQRTGLTVPVLSSMLLRMELEGEVVANPGGTYGRCAG